MADTVKYGMGQLRYVGSSSYMQDQNFTTKTVKTMITSADDSGSGSSEFYQDIYLEGNTNFTFVAGTPYLLHLDIPKDLSYDCLYYIKLIKSPGSSSNTIIDTSSLDYQLIKYISVPRAVGVGNTSRVILYPVNSSNKPGIDTDGSYTTKIAIAKTLNESPKVGEVVFDEPTGKYYIYDGSESEGYPAVGNSIEILNKNDSIMEHTWATSNITTESVGFDIIFTPRSSNATYDGIYLQMVRNSLDYDIYLNNVYGRKIDTSNPNWNAKVYQLTNLITGTSGSVPSPLINIGVYSHPNLLMAINGEEIRVGQSGYYELNDFEITSLAVAASDANDKFTIDYQYKTS